MLDGDCVATVVQLFVYSCFVTVLVLGAFYNTIHLTLR